MPAAALGYLLLAGAGYTLVALLLLGPVVGAFATAIPGGPVAHTDGWQNVWNLWWVQQALTKGQNPFETPLLFYPQGASLYLQTLGITNGLLVLPVTLIWGPVAGYNTALLLALTLTGLAGYALALHVITNRWAAFLAGLLLTCTPFHLTRVWDGQLELAALQWPTLYLLFLVRALEGDRRRDALLAGILLAITGLTSWYYLLFMVLMSLGVLVLWAVPLGRGARGPGSRRTTDDRPPTTDSGGRTTDDGRPTTDDQRLTTASAQHTTNDQRPTTASKWTSADDGQQSADDGQQQADGVQQTARSGQQSAVSSRRTAVGGRRKPGALVTQAALTAAVAVALLLPVLVPALDTATREGAVVQPEPDEVVARSANLLDFWLPSYLHPLWGDAVFAWVKPAWHNFSGDWNAALGYSVVALAVLGAVRNWRIAWRWFVLAGGALLFALGPELQIAGWRSGLPLPYALLDQLPGLSLGRRPVLFVAAATIALVPPTALGLAALDKLIRRRGHPLAQPSANPLPVQTERAEASEIRRSLQAASSRSPWLRGFVAQAEANFRKAVLVWALPLTLIAFELMPRPWPPLSADVHPAYHTLRDEAGAVLEVPPAAYKYVEPQRAQLVHGQPIPGGYLARPPSYPWPNLMPAVRPLWKMRPEPADPFLAGSDGPVAALRSYGIGAVVVRWNQIEPERREAVNAALAQALPGVAPAYSDETLALYRVPDGSAGPIAALAGDGWQRPEGDGAQRWRWMGPEGDLVLINPGPDPERMTLTLAAHSFQRPRVVQLTLDGAPAGEWIVGLDRTEVTLHYWLTPGVHRLTLTAPADREPIAGSSRELSIALREARLESR
jgi:hypothetical protein